MSWHPVMRPKRHRTSVLEVSFFTVVATAILALVYAQALTVQVRIDGRDVRFPAGATVADVLGGGYVRGVPGDLIGVDGSVVRRGGGGSPSVLRNGRRAYPATRLHAGDVLASSDGPDAAEPTIEGTLPVEPPVEVSGRGSFTRVVDEGRPGVARVVRGAESGIVVTSETVEPPEPAHVLRFSRTGGAMVVALTFDDGPWPGQTERILDILKKEKVPATFFMLGSRAKKSPAVARRVAAEGHQVATHSFSHKKIWTESLPVVRREVRRGAEAVEEASGVHPRWFRPPGGRVTGLIAAEARIANLKIVLWDVDPSDWRQPRASVIARRVVGATEPGSVVLLHDGGGDREQTITALPWIIHGLQKKGYTFVTLDQMEQLDAP